MQALPVVLTSELRSHVGHSVQVKAAGGIRNYEDAAKIRACGATRILT